MGFSLVNEAHFSGLGVEGLLTLINSKVTSVLWPQANMIRWFNTILRSLYRSRFSSAVWKF